MGDIDKIFKEVFDDINFDKKIVEKKESEPQIDKIKEYINELFFRFESYQQKFGIGVIDDKILNKSIEMMLDKMNCSLGSSNFDCRCGTNIEVKYVVKKDRIGFYGHPTNIDGYDNYIYDYSDHIRFYQYVFYCSHCGERCIINSSTEFVDVLEILSKKRFNYDRIE